MPEKNTYITNKSQLIEYIEQGCKPINQWSIGVEHERFIYQLPEQERAPYEGEKGIQALLTSFKSDKWETIQENKQTIAMKLNHAQITLEPGGQFELSGAPLPTIHDVSDELLTYNKTLEKHCRELGLGMLNHGLDPKTRRDNMPWMPKKRYEIMRNYMPQVGKLGLDMMTATATVQVNLDFSSELDLTKKMRVGIAVQPIATALFANSPIHNGKLTGYKSYRAHIWTDTDHDRCGLLNFVFNETFTYEKYVDYILDVPMYFIKRGSEYEDHAGQSFHDFMDGHLPHRIGEKATMKDFEDHLTVAFPEVRLKRYIEMRGADNGSPQHNLALAAFWTGLLYDPDTLDRAFEYVKTWTFDEIKKLQAQTNQNGLATQFKKEPLAAIANELLKISHQGLKKRNCLNSEGFDETIYLNYIELLIAENKCPADDLISDFTQNCGENIELFLNKHLK